MRIASTSSVAEQDALARRAAEGDVDAERVWIESHRAGVATWATRLGLDPTRELVDSALAALTSSARNGFDFSRGYVLGLWAFADVQRVLETFAAHDARRAAAARAGELEALAELVTSARAHYRWLQVAIDAGHEDAEDVLSDLEEQSELRYDDAGSERRAAHWRVALDYLGGRHGLPRDVELGAMHLDEAFSFRPALEVLVEIEVANAEHHDLDAARVGLDEEAARVLDAAIVGAPARRVSHLLDRLERLLELAAPRVICDAELERLEAAVATVAPDTLDAATWARVERCRSR